MVSSPAGVPATCLMLFVGTSQASWLGIGEDVSCVRSSQRRPCNMPQIFYRSLSSELAVGNR